MKNSLVRNIFLGALAFLAIGALGGGIVLVISPSGELIGLPVSAFKNMPFNSFLVPGIILFMVLGLLPSILVYALIKKPESKLAEGLNLFNDMYWAWSFSVYVALCLVGWIHIELIFLADKVYWLHTFYLFYAIFLVVLALLPGVRAHYKRSNMGNNNPM